MRNGDLRHDILDQARRLLTDGDHLTSGDSEEILKLLNVLVLAIERNTGSNEAEKQARRLATDLIKNRTLVFALKQQADELDALKKLSLSLTSSLDIKTVLDAVVTEAMRLVKNARSSHIFLYTKNKLEFGAALDDDGVRDKPQALPRPNGLTYMVARNEERIIIEDIKRHPLYANTPADWQGSIIGIPLMINTKLVGVMNLSRSTRGGFSSSDLR